MRKFTLLAAGLLLVAACGSTAADAGDETPTTVPPVASGGAEGAGCTPGAGDLPDGRWYGLVTAAGPESLDFDLACWFTGEAARAAAAEDGAEEPPNDYYVRNDNPALRTLSTTGAATAVWYTSGDPNSETAGTYAEWLDMRAAREFQLAVWLKVAGGAVVEVHEQWVP